MPTNGKIAGTLRGKLLITFGLLLLLAMVFWIINKRAFNDINGVVAELTLPNEKQALLDELHEGLSVVLAGQRRETLKNDREPSAAYTQQTDALKGTIDSLVVLFAAEPVQLKRMHFIDSIFERQLTVYEIYLKNRHHFLNANLQQDELDSLNKDLEANKIVLDSNVTSWENTTRTYTLLPPIKLPESTTPKNKRRFSKKNEQDASESTSEGLQIMVEKTSEVHADTTQTLPRKDSLLRRVESSFSSVDSIRQRKLSYLQRQEVQLLNNNEQLLSLLMVTIDQVRNDEKIRADQHAEASIDIAKSTIDLTEKLTFAFIGISGILLILIVWDLARMNSYRRQLELSKAEAEYHSIAKQRFLSNMSHEIRTPLQSVIGFSELLRQEVPDAKKYLQPLLSASDHLLQVVNEILDYSQVVSGKIKLQQQPFNIFTLLHEVSETASWDCRRKGLDWNYAEEPAISENCTVLGDELRLRQVLFNLIANAVKYTDSGKIGLHVRTTFDKGLLCLQCAVSDTGEGIPQDKLRIIFEAFEQNEAHYTKGSGLGLSIVKELVDSMDGSMDVESTVGAGSVFTVSLTFPLAAAIVPPTSDEVPDLRSVSGSVWVVDDDSLINSLCAQLMEQQGIPHTCFETAEALLAHPWDDRVRLVFCDFRLPGMNGGQLCQELKTRHPDVAIVALTAQVLPEERATLLEKGFDDLLLKPFKKQEFYATIARFLPPVQADFDWYLLDQMITDPEERAAVIADFRRQSLEDLEALQRAIRQKERDTCLLLVHRLAGRMEQMGGKELGRQLRACERRLLSEEEDETIDQEMQAAISQVEQALQRV